jgi:hypothetical protein
MRSPHITAMAALYLEPSAHAAGQKFRLLGIKIQLATEGADLLRDIIKLDAGGLEALVRIHSAGLLLDECGLLPLQCRDALQLPLPNAGAARY